MNSPHGRERQHRLAKFLRPRSVALVGIPGDASLPLARPLTALRVHGFGGTIYPVNPRHQSIADLRCYPTVRALPEAPDLAWIAVPGEHVVPVLDDCLAAGIRQAVVVSAGFAESGAIGESRQAAIEQRARAEGLTVLGPNSIGFINVWDRAPLSFSAALELASLRPGTVAIVSQSGGFGGIIFNRLQDRGIEVGYVISTGNEAGISLEECVEFLVDDSRTRIIVLVVECLRNPGRFWRAADRALAADKPIVALRLGISELGQQLTRAHTGARPSVEAWGPRADDFGVVTIEDLDEVLDTVMWYQRARNVTPRRVAVVTSSGGVAVQFADRLTAAGFDLPPLGGETRRRLRELLPVYAMPNNPLDITAALPENTFRAAVDAIVTSEEIDTLILPMPMLGRAQSEERAAMVERLHRPGLTLVVCWLAGSLAEPGVTASDRAGLPCFTSVMRMVRTITAVRHRDIQRSRRLQAALEA